MTRLAFGTIIVAIVVSLTAASHAAVTLTGDQQQWQQAAGSFTTLDFTGFPPFTPITTQYESLGATFTDGPGGSTDFVRNVPALFPLDGWGLDGGLNDEIHISFSTPQLSLATHFTGLMGYQLFSGMDLIYTSPILFDNGPGTFAGVVSTQAFDSVVLRDPVFPGVVVDNIYFAPGIPGPGGLALLSAAGLVQGRRRRA